MRGGARDPDALTVGEIEALLEDRIEALVADLFPAGRKDGHEFCIGSLAGEPGQSLRIHIGTGSKRGWWKDFSSNDPRDRGDALKLVAQAQFAGDIGKAVLWSKSWLGLDDADPARLQQRRREAKAQKQARDRAVVLERAQKIERAVKRWHAARPLVEGDPVWRYLVETRAIDLQLLPRLPRACRFHPNLQYGFGDTAWHGPAMLWPIVLGGRHVATHRTWLAQNEDGSWRKADERELGLDSKGKPNAPKKVMGPYQIDELGGHIPIWKGGQPRVSLLDVAPGTGIVSGEGPEDALTAAVADPSLYVIAMISVGNLAVLQLPPQMGALTLLTQNDPEGSEAARAIKTGIAVHRRAGRRVMAVLPDASGKDINDMARAAKAAPKEGPARGMDI